MHLGTVRRGAVVEELPAGFSYVSNSVVITDPDPPGNAIASPRELGSNQVRFSLLGVNSFSYKVTASSMPGSYPFSGRLRDFDGSDHQIGGDNRVTVEEPTPTPVPPTPTPVPPTATPEPPPTATPVTAGEVSRIESRAKSVTLSAGDEVVLGVLIYGLQDVNDQGLASDVTFEWTQDKDVEGKEKSLEGTGAEINYTAPSSPGTYQITASLDADECQGGCEATVTVRVRRPAAAPDPADPPQNPPGEIPSILTDGDGNNYEVFTPEDGGSFTGEGYSITAAAGAIPQRRSTSVSECPTKARHPTPA